MRKRGLRGCYGYNAPPAFKAPCLAVTRRTGELLACSGFGGTCSASSSILSSDLTDEGDDRAHRGSIHRRDGDCASRGGDLGTPAAGAIGTGSSSSGYRAQPSSL